MAWVKAQIEIKTASVGTGIKVSLRKSAKSSANMLLAINGAVGEKLGWTDGDNVEVLIGDKEHHGLIRLKKSNAGQVSVQRRETAKGHWWQLKLGHQSAFVDRSETALWCQWEEVDGGWVEIVLPKWADETAPTRKTVATAPAPRPAMSARPARSVTAALMGDPPPGRREMLQKMGEIASK